MRLPPLHLGKDLYKYFMCSLLIICYFSGCFSYIVTDSHHATVLVPPSLSFTDSSALASSIAKLNLMILAHPVQPIGLLQYSSTIYLLWSDPALNLRLFPNHRLQWALSHGMGPAFGHKINASACRQGLQPVSHLFRRIVRDEAYPEVVFCRALSKCTFLVYLKSLLLTALEGC